MKKLEKGTLMIYTITLNPSLDYIVDVEDFQTGQTNRTASEEIWPGGKGLNVSMVLDQLGIESTALGFLAGFTGEEIARRITGKHIYPDFIKVSRGLSRINLKLRTIDGTEINGSGPEITEKDMALLLNQLDGIQKGEILVLAGSVPPALPEDIYRQMMVRAKASGAKVVVDTTGEKLLSVLPERPFLVKPNNHELGDIFGVKLETRREVLPWALKLKEMGAENVIVSLAGEGAVMVSAEGDIFEAPAPEGRLINAVGAGDAMVAGFLAGSLLGDAEKAFRLAVAAGSANAFSPHLATKEAIEDICRKVDIRKGIC